MSRIFISYRRDDSEATAFLLRDHIASRFGDEMVFFDLGSIEPGEDFTKVISSRLELCEIFVVVIGKKAFAKRQSQDLHEVDWFVSEIEEALKRRARVLPVLVNGAKPLAASKLPDSIKSLAYIQALPISSTHFDYDIRRLVGILEKHLARADRAAPKTTASTFEPSPDQWYYIMSRGTNLAIDVAGASKDDGATVFLWNAPGWVKNQLWKFVLSDGEYYGVIAKHSDRCLDVLSAGKRDGSTLIQYPWRGTPNQQWRIESTATGSYRFVARHSELCLDRDDLAFGCGSRLQTWQQNNWPNQEWDLIREEDLLLSQHFLIEVDAIVGARLASHSVSALFGLLSELTLRRATFQCWLSPRLQEILTPELVERLWKAAPSCFSRLTAGMSTTEAVLVAKQGNERAYVITNGEVLQRAEWQAFRHASIVAETSDGRVYVRTLRFGSSPDKLEKALAMLLMRLDVRWLSAATNQTTWVQVRADNPIPENALRGGQEGDGTPLYVCRAFHNGGLHPGKVVNGMCNIGYGGREIVVGEYEVPICPSGQWGKPEPGCASSLIGGYENGNPLFIGRTQHEEGVHPGKVLNTSCNFGFAGREIVKPDFEVFRIPR